MNDFRDRVAIVTGAATGIGEAIAETLLSRGARVVLASRDGVSTMATARRLDPSGERTFAIEVDVRQERACRSVNNRSQGDEIDILLDIIYLIRRI